MNTNILTHGNAYKLLTITPKDERLADLMTTLQGLGYSSALVGSDDHGAHAVAIELPCGLPLYINFQYKTYSERNKGFLHFFTFTSIRSDKINSAKTELKLDEPARFTLKTITTKKLAATIAYWDKVGAHALTLDSAATKVLDDWRAKLAAAPYEFCAASSKENSSTAINGRMYSDKFEYSLSLSASYPHPSQQMRYRGGQTLNDFLALSDDVSDEKQWFAVDFTGLSYTHAGFMCYGTEYAVEAWCERQKRDLGAWGFICNAADLDSRTRFVVIVRLRDLL